jgi:F-type H+-transporting ATPase subunit a
MGVEFLSRVRKVTLALTVAAAIATAVYVGPAFGAALLFGSLWSLANLLWLEALGRLAFASLKGEELSAADIIKTSVGFPLLLAGGAAILVSGLPILGSTIGFWVLFAVALLKGLGVMLARALDFRTGRSLELRGDAVKRPMPSRRSQGVVGWIMVLVLGAGLVLFAVASPEPPAEDHAASATQESEHAAGSDGKESRGGGHGEDDIPHMPTFISILNDVLPENPVTSFLYEWEDIFFAILAAVLIVILVRTAFADPQMVPGRAQGLAELVAGGMRDFVRETFGEHMIKYVPFLGTTFLYILVMNYMGLVPLLKAPTANLNTTLAMALVVFFYAQYTAIKVQGLGGYLYHLAGEPKDILGWMVAILLFPIEVMGELIKPISLAARLFGNIFGEDLLIAVFIGIGALLMSWQPIPIGFPIHVIFYALALTMGAVQALVFALLAAVYLYMAQPQHEHEEEHHAAEESGTVPAHA